MNTRNAMFHKLAALFYTPLATYLRNRRIVLAFHDFGNQFSRQIYAEGLWKHIELRKTVDRLYTRYYWDINAHCTSTLHKREILSVIEKHLRYSILCTGIGLHLEHSKVALHVWGLFVLFGIACHTERERLATLLHCRAVNKETFIETVYLTH